MNPDDQEYFEDVYTGVWNEKMLKYDSVNNKVERINGPGFESMSWLSKDGLKAVVTINNYATNRFIGYCGSRIHQKRKMEYPESDQQ
ncbi:hypothetical protein D3C86_1712100 [compost metagenome]